MEIRDNGYVPKYAGDTSYLPERLENAMTAFGVNPSKVQIVRFLSLTEEGATTGTIAKELNLKYQTVLRHLTSLEERGVVICDVPLGERQGRRTPFRVNPEEVKREIREFQDLLLGE